MTQIFNDGSDMLIKNMNSDNQQLDTIVKQLKQLTEPQQINAMVHKMLTLGILTEKDVTILKEKGIQMEPEKVESKAIEPVALGNNEEEMELE